MYNKTLCKPANTMTKPRHKTKVQNTPPPNGVRQNSRPYYFLCTPPHRRWQAHRPATLHATVLFHSVAACQVPPKRRFLIFFCFSSAPETTIFLLTRRSATLPMCARGGTCVIDAPRRQWCLALDIYTKIGYIP